MWCCIKLVIILTVCVPLAYSQAVVVTITKEEKFNCPETYTLKCQVSGTACCTGTSTRIWRKENVQIMSDGAELITSGKYSESVSDAENYFTLTINNINDDDFSKDFVCSYSFFTSNSTRLNKDVLDCPPCWICIAICLACTLGGMIGVYLLQYTSLLCSSLLTNLPCHNNCSVSNNDVDSHYIFCGKDYVISKKKKSLLIAIIVNLVGLILYGLIPGLCFGWFCYICYVGLAPLLLLFALGALLFIVIFYWTLEFHSDENFSIWRYLGYVALTFLILPLIVLVPYMCCKGGNNRSKESGSSCWPPCSVGPDPNSPDPENARSLLKKNADKKNEKKPVAVVRSQPPKNRHVKTDNTESTRYSAETEIFDEGVHKSAKPRPLPSIGQPTNSPRPLPQMPPSSQLEKGGIQLEPLGDSTSEKKKKKRRKKKESKQSGDED